MSSTEKLTRVEIVTPVHNRRDITLQCLKSLARVNKDGLDVHVIIVDDGSTDGTSEAIVENFPEVEIVRGDGNLWFTAGTNRGIEAALKHNPDYVLTINDDEVFDESFLHLMIETAQRNPRSIVGALLLLWDTPHKIFQVSPRWELSAGGFRHWVQQTIWTVPKKPWEVELIVGNCVLFPVAAIKECGLMNEKRFPHFGDAEYTPRMRRRGWRLLIEPRARVFCQPNNLPARVRNMPFKKLMRTLFVDLGNAHSLRRRFLATWHGAPNRFEGAIAFPIFLMRWAFGKNIEGSYANGKWKVENISIFHFPLSVFHFLVFQFFEPVADHFVEHCFKRVVGRPAGRLAEFRSVAFQIVKFFGSQISFVDENPFLPVQIELAENVFDQILNAVRDAGRADVIVGRVHLQNLPHRLDVICRVSPIARRLHISEFEAVGLFIKNSHGFLADLVGDKVRSAARAFVVKQNSVADKKFISVAVISRQMIGENLCAAVGRNRVHRRRFALKAVRFNRVAEHFGRRRLVNLDVGFHQAHGFEHVDGRKPGRVRRVNRLVERNSNVRLSGEMIKLVGLNFLDDVNQRR
jgi:GT2 family glycosyltransferase